MVETYQSGEEVTLYPEMTDYNGNVISPIESTYTLFGKDGVIVASQPVDLYSGDVPQLIVTSANNTLGVGESVGYRRVEISTKDENNKVYIKSLTYYIRTIEGLVKGTNSFGNLAELSLVAYDMIHLKAFHGASDTEKTSALIQAWNNLGQLPVSFVDLEGTDSYDKSSTRELIDTDIDLLLPKTYQRLLRAQVIEADDVLGGNPIEARRRLGLISDSAGESAHFFRTSKPLNLPCCRAAIDELRGIVSWNVRIDRA